MSPFIEWSPDEMAERIAILPFLATEDLRDLADSLSEGKEDISESMLRYYDAVQTELVTR